MNSSSKNDASREILQFRLSELRERFIQRMREDRNALARAWDCGDKPAVRERAHRLAGVAASFGFPAIGGAAAEVQDALDTSSSGAEPETAIMRLIALLENCEGDSE